MKEAFHILIVDDSAANRFTLQALLQREDSFAILEADSGEQALALTVEHRVDLILLDVQMPGLDGYETARHLKMATNTRDIPIIFITAVFKSEEFARRGYAVGAVDYLTKPIDDNLLLNRIRLYIKLINRERHLRQAMAELQEKDRSLRSVNKALELQLRERTVELNQASDAIISADEKGNVTFWNQGAERTFRYLENEILGQPLTLLVPERYREAHLNGIKQVIATGHLGLSGKVVELSGLRKGGVEFPLEVSLSSGVADGRRRFSAVIRDITDRKRMEDQLREAKEAAERANQSKSTFLATMSHEIRTPLNAILGMTELLKEVHLSESHGWYVDTLSRSGEALLTLINDILDLSRIEANQLTLEMTPFDLVQSIQEVIELFTFSALEKKITLSHQLDEGVPSWVQGDPTRLRQVLLNLVGNAVKFTSTGEVSIGVACGVGDQLLFTVVDTGPGIPKEKQTEIFDSFTQADPSTTRNHGGSGLGLTICRRLVKLMGGEISLESEPGQGSCFTVMLTLPRVSEDAIPKGENATLSANGSAPIFKPAPFPSSPSPVASGGVDGHTSPLPKATILLVDDSEDNRLLVQAFLQKSPYQLVMAENGAEAVASFKSERFDLVLMDIQMPVIDGYEATRQIRAWESTHQADPTPIIALTAHALAEESEQIKAAGCDLHLTKPIKKKRLLNVLEQFLHG
ncbi:MAG: response regulator [Magnetococcales bacterium]|nr:response regulator [Magnetococcales bacterium]